MTTLTVDGTQNFHVNTENSFDAIPSYFGDLFSPVPIKKNYAPKQNFNRKRYSWLQIGTNRKYLVSHNDIKLTIFRTKKISLFIDSLTTHYAVEDSAKLKSFLIKNYRTYLFFEKLLTFVKAQEMHIQETSINLVENVDDVGSFVNIEFFVGAEGVDALELDDSFKSSNPLFKSIPALEFYFL